MGVSILGKDVSLISSIAGKAKTNVSNVGGIGGWAGEVVDVTPTPTPNWNDPYSTNSPPTTINQTIQGISTPINLFWSCVYCGDGGTVEYSINEGAWIAIAPNINFSINNNDTLKFRMVDLDYGTLIADIKNASDGNVILDTITLQKDLD